MATWKAGNVTSQPSDFSMTMNGKTTVTGIVSWDSVTLPSDATITSTTLVGTPTYSGSGNVNSVTVNGTTVSLNVEFSVSLGTSLITSISVSATGNNKNATGTFSITGMLYTVEYQVVGATYTVTFKDWDGSTIDTQTVEEGESATPPSDPSRDGYKFTGWLGDYTNITSNVEIIAQYEEIVLTKNIYIGNTKINSIYLGNANVIKIYLGNILIFEK